MRVFPAAASLAVKKALFVDLAGVLLDDTPISRPNLGDGSGVSTERYAGLRGGAGAALRLLDRLDYRVVILMPCALDRRRSAHVGAARISDLLFRERIAVEGICACCDTGAPCTGCPPAPGMLLRAAHSHGLALDASWLLAGRSHYLTAARQAGCRSILIGAAAPCPEQLAPCTTGDVPAYQSRDIVDAALAIIRLDGT